MSDKLGEIPGKISWHFPASFAVPNGSHESLPKLQNINHSIACGENSEFYLHELLGSGP